MAADVMMAKPLLSCVSGTVRSTRSYSVANTGTAMTVPTDRASTIVVNESAKTGARYDTARPVTPTQYSVSLGIRHVLTAYAAPAARPVPLEIAQSGPISPAEPIDSANTGIVTCSTPPAMASIAARRPRTAIRPRPHL